METTYNNKTFILECVESSIKDVRQWIAALRRQGYEAHQKKIVNGYGKTVWQIWRSATITYNRGLKLKFRVK